MICRFQGHLFFFILKFQFENKEKEMTLKPANHFKLMIDGFCREINKFNSLKYYEGKIKFIIQTRDRKTLYYIGSIIPSNKNPISIYEKIGKQSINFVAYFKALFYKNIINNSQIFLNQYLTNIENTSSNVQ